MKKFQWKLSSARMRCPYCQAHVKMVFVGRWRIYPAETKEVKKDGGGGPEAPTEGDI